MTECPTHTPDFYIVGAPKCGTTALYEYLKTHPNIFLPAVKEPTYFAKEFRAQRSYIGTPQAYSALYKAATKTQLTGDASPYYLASDTAIQNILRCNPAAKFIAIIRNPLDMLPSYHAQLLRSLVEDEPVLETAWSNQSPITHPGLNYRKICTLGTQIKHLINIVPENQRHIIIYDDFKVDTRATYQSLLNFLTLPDDGRANFARINKRKKLRSPALQKALRGMYYALKPLKPIVNALGLRPFSKLSQLNQASATTNTSMSPAFKQKLLQEFSEDITLLEDLLGQDFSHWRA